MEVIHDIKNHKFYCIVDGLECFASYSVIDYKILDFNNTYTPTQLRGKGLARKLFEEIVKYLEENDLKAVASCSYAESFFSEDKYKKYLRK